MKRWSGTTAFPLKTWGRIQPQRPAFFNWAALHPARIAAICLDAPFATQQAGWAAGEKGKAPWKAGAICWTVYGLTEQEALSGKLNPGNKLAPPR